MSAAYEFVPYPFASRTYGASLPLLHDGRDPQRRPVVVVGGGPVGYCTALGLANHGVPVVVLEADDSVCFGSRAICISRMARTLATSLRAFSTAVSCMMLLPVCSLYVLLVNEFCQEKSQRWAALPFGRQET